VSEVSEPDDEPSAESEGEHSDHTDEAADLVALGDSSRIASIMAAEVTILKINKDP
jgi:hypothetical protein